MRLQPQTAKWLGFGACTSTPRMLGRLWFFYRGDFHFKFSTQFVSSSPCLWRRGSWFLKFTRFRFRTFCVPVWPLQSSEVLSKPWTSRSQDSPLEDKAQGEERIKLVLIECCQAWGTSQSFICPVSLYQVPTVCWELAQKIPILSEFGLHEIDEVQQAQDAAQTWWPWTRHFVFLNLRY